MTNIKNGLALAAAALLLTYATPRTAARAPQAQVRIGPDFYRNLPAELAELRAECERELQTYNELCKPFEARMLDLTEHRLSDEAATGLNREFDAATGTQEKHVRQLNQRYRNRFTELKQAYLAFGNATLR